MAGMKAGNLIFIRSTDPRANAADWLPVKPEDVPAALKEPETLGRLVANPGWMATLGDEHYMVLKL